MAMQEQQQSEQTSMEIRISQSHEPEEHRFVKSIGDLAALSTAINAFKRHYDDLQSHIEFIQSAIDARLSGVEVSVALPEIDAAANEPPQESAAAVLEPSEKSEAQRLCESMCSKGLRRYISANLAEPAKLFEEIPEALKLASDPSKLVFECIGRFYLQGRKAFAKDSPMIPARKASLLALECFLLMAERDDAKTMVEKSTKVEVEKAVLAWKKRLMSEGGFANAEPMDARGLLLLIACFGVPSNFGNMNLLDLVRQSKAFEISGSLRRSTFLVSMIPGVINSSIKRGMHIDAVELVYIFGLEDKFSPPSILTSLLRMNKEAFEKAKRTAFTPMALKEAKEKQLAALRSVIRCLETCNLDPAKVLSGWQIKDQIIKLEKDIVEHEKEIVEKERSVRVMENALQTERLYNREMKRPRLSGTEMPMPASSYSPAYHDRSFPNRAGGDDISALVSSYLGSPSSFLHRSSSLRSSSDNVTVHVHGLGRGVPAFEPHMAGSLPARGYSPIHGHSLSRQFSPIQRESLPWQYSPIGGQNLSGQQVSLGLQSVVRHSPSAERIAGWPSRSSCSNPPSY